MGALDELLRMSRRGLLGLAALALIPKSLRAEPDTLAVLDAAAARILPSDDGPGAREAKVGRFIARQLETSFAELKPAFDQLAKLLDAWARKAAGAPFVELAPSAQDRVLDDLANGRIPARGLPQQVLFRALHSLTLEGFLSDPIHGGNDAMVGWRAIGFPTPHLRVKGERGHHH